MWWAYSCTQVSLAIRLAVGITEVQAATNTDQLLATWLASPTNIRNAIVRSGVQDPIGPGAIIKWLMTPEIWVAPVSRWAGGVCKTGCLPGAECWQPCEVMLRCAGQ